MKIIPETPEERLMCAIFGTIQFYPTVLIEETEETIGLKEGVRRALDNLPLTKGKKDAQPWPRLKKIIELRFGFSTRQCETFKRIDQNFQVTKTAIQQQEAKALRLLRRPLRKFVPLSFEGAEKLKAENKILAEKNQLLEKSNSELSSLLKNVARVPGHLVEMHLTDNLEKANLNVKRSEIFLMALAARFPRTHGSKLHTRTWNALRRHCLAGRVTLAIKNIQELKAWVYSNKISMARNIGAKGIAFLKEAIQIIENEKG